MLWFVAQGEGICFLFSPPFLILVSPPLLFWIFRISKSTPGENQGEDPTYSLHCCTLSSQEVLTHACLVTHRDDEYIRSVFKLFLPPLVRCSPLAKKQDLSLTGFVAFKSSFGLLFIITFGGQVISSQITGPPSRKPSLTRHLFMDLLPCPLGALVLLWSHHTYGHCAPMTTPSPPSFPLFYPSRLSFNPHASYNLRTGASPFGTSAPPGFTFSPQ